MAQHSLLLYQCNLQKNDAAVPTSPPLGGVNRRASAGTSHCPYGCASNCCKAGFPSRRDRACPCPRLPTITLFAGDNGQGPALSLRDSCKNMMDTLVRLRSSETVLRIGHDLAETSRNKDCIAKFLHVVPGTYVQISNFIFLHHIRLLLCAIGKARR